MVKENCRQRTVVLFFKIYLWLFLHKKTEKSERNVEKSRWGKVVFVQNNEKKEDNKNILTKVKKIDMNRIRVSM